MLQFEVGDKVKRINSSYAGIKINDIATVREVLDYSTGIRLVEFGVIYNTIYDVKNFILVKKAKTKPVKVFGISKFMDKMNKK
jgi:hypothetical protein